MDVRRAEFWRTLLAMGFAPQTATVGAYSGMELDAHVFERGVYHTKAAELILQFLLTRLDRERFRREFFDCWPIGDPRQARDFRGRAFKWVDEVRQMSVERADGQWPRDVPVRRSFMDECRGARFEEILWALAQFVAGALLRKGSEWAAHIKYPLVSPASLEPATVEKCRARYARRTRDRQAAQSAWSQTAAQLQQQIASARQQRSQAHEAFRACRKRLAADVSGARTPDADCSPADVEQLLAAAVHDASQLWAASAGWVEAMAPAIDMVEMVADSRANAVRLDAARQLRLAPPAALSDQWTQWLADRHATPFRGPKVDLQVLARMAAASVQALRGSMDAGSANVSLEPDTRSRPGPLADCGTRLQRLDDAITQQDARIARLKRVRAQLVDQQRAALRIARGPEQRSERGAMAQLTAVISDAVGRGSSALSATRRTSAGRHRPAAERMVELADAWDDLATGEPYPPHLVDAAVHGQPADSTPFSTSVATLGRSSMTLTSSRGFRTPPAVTQLTGGVAALSCTRKRPLDTAGSESTRSWKRPASVDRSMSDSDMLLDDEVPDFLVD
ncbi:hypothetical protein H4R19_000226 [Coemansia spiralis]|nr:hypothetical protein H4R19_000226 [Coemansia spiralis]